MRGARTCDVRRHRINFFLKRRRMKLLCSNSYGSKAGVIWNEATSYLTGSSRTHGSSQGPGACDLEHCVCDVVMKS